MTELPILEFKNVDTYYGNIQVLYDINFKVYAGELVCLLGGNASGKSTTLKTILGVCKVKKGTVKLNGERIDGKDPSAIVRMGIAQVLEGRRIFAEMSVDDNLRTGAFTNSDRGSVAAAHERVMELFPVLQGRRKDTAGYLSGGEQQMLAIGRALMADPRLLILDEPTLGLAPMLVQQIRGVVVDINRQGTSVLLIEQNANMALSIADYGYIMETGKVVMDGDPDKLLGDEDVQEFYLGLHGEGGAGRRAQEGSPACRVLAEALGHHHPDLLEVLAGMGF